MTKKERRVFVRGLINNLTPRILAASDRAPDTWDGHELRTLIAEHFDNEVAGDVRPAYRKRTAGSAFARKRTREYRAFLLGY